MQSNYPQHAPEQQPETLPEDQAVAMRLYTVHDSVKYHTEVDSASADVIPFIARQATESFNSTQNPVAEHALNQPISFLEQANANVDDAYETAA